jgi:hypothetical protein
MHLMSTSLWVAGHSLCTVDHAPGVSEDGVLDRGVTASAIAWIEPVHDEVLNGLVVCPASGRGSEDALQLLGVGQVVPDNALDLLRVGQVLPLAPGPVLALEHVWSWPNASRRLLDLLAVGSYWCGRKTRRSGGQM